MKKIKKALISVSDKSNLKSLLKILKKNKIEIISSGGTYKEIIKLGFDCLEVSKYTGFPEIMDGRVKTINPLIEGGILGLRDIHNNDAKSNSIEWIDLVIQNPEDNQLLSDIFADVNALCRDYPVYPD